MKIAFFEDRYFEVYGAQENLLLLAEFVNNDKIHSCEFITTWSGKLEETAKCRNLDVSIIEAPESLRKFEKHAIRGGPIRMIRASILSLIYSLKVFKTLNSMDVDVIVISSIRASLLLTFTRIFGKQKTIMFAQNSTPFGIFSAFSLPGIDFIGLISSGSRSTFPEWAIRRHSGRIRDLASGRDLTRFSHAVRERKDQSTRYVTVCSITKRKGLHVLLNAFKKLQAMVDDVVLDVVGGTSGEESEEYLIELKNFVSTNNLTVNFLGWTDTNNVIQHLNNSDVFVLASENEGLPGVIIEAMATGLPVISSDAGGCADAVADGVNGFIVPIGDENALVERMKDLLDKHKRSQFGKTGRKIATERYSVGAFSERFLKIIDEVKN